MAVQLRLMGNPEEVAAIMAALKSGEPVTVLTDDSPVPNRDGADVRMFGHAELPGYVPPSADRLPPLRRVPPRHGYRGRRGLGR